MLISCVAPPWNIRGRVPRLFLSTPTVLNPTRGMGSSATFPSFKALLSFPLHSSFHFPSQFPLTPLSSISSTVFFIHSLSLLFLLQYLFKCFLYPFIFILLSSHAIILIHHHVDPPRVFFTYLITSLSLCSQEFAFLNRKEFLAPFG